MAREDIANRLISKPGRDLVLVRYTEDHNCHNEWVYNAANIDDSEIVWAREISPGTDQDLVNYFSDRNIWILNADAKVPRLIKRPNVGQTNVSNLTSQDSEQAPSNSNLSGATSAR